MDEVIVIVLLATLFAICFGAVEIYIRLNDDKKPFGFGRKLYLLR